MKPLRSLLLLCVAASLPLVAAAQDKKPEGQPSAPQAHAAGQESKGGMPADMDEKAMWEMMEKLGAPGDNHKLLETYMVGDWTYTMKSFHGPEPEESTGTMTTKSVYGGRYFVGQLKGTISVPGPDGKKEKKQFEGTSTTTFNNSTEKFQNTWIDSMSTGIFISEGTYDASTKTFTYSGTMDYGPMKCTSRIVIKLIDKNKHTMEMHESMGGAPEMKTMEITYTRKGSAS